MKKVIDFHTHFFPPGLQNSIYDWFDKHGWGIYKRYTLEESVNYLKSLGYAKWVVAVYSHRGGVSESLNEWLHTISIQHPEIIPFGTVHPEEDTGKIVRDAFEKHGVRGIKFHTHIARTPPEDPRLYPAYEEIMRHDGILLLHGSHHPTDGGFINDFDPAEFSGAEHIAILLERFPGLKVVVAHGGMGEYDQFADLMDRYDNLFLDTAMLYCMDRVSVKHPQTPPPPPASFMKKYHRRILLGSDFPFIPYPVERQLEALEKLPLTEKELKRITFENASTGTGVQDRYHFVDNFSSKQVD